MSNAHEHMWFIINEVVASENGRFVQTCFGNEELLNFRLGDVHKSLCKAKIVL